jgi:hypothetical protein
VNFRINAHYLYIQITRPEENRAFQCFSTGPQHNKKKNLSIYEGSRRCTQNFVGPCSACYSSNWMVANYVIAPLLAFLQHDAQEQRSISSMKYTMNVHNQDNSFRCNKKYKPFRSYITEWCLHIACVYIKAADYLMRNCSSSSEINIFFFDLFEKQNNTEA